MTKPKEKPKPMPKKDERKLAVKSIECLTELDCVGGKEGILSGKSYTFKILEYQEDTPTEEEKKNIKWNFSYSTEEGVVVGTETKKIGDTFTLNIEEIGVKEAKFITIYTYFEDRNQEAQLEIEVVDKVLIEYGTLQKGFFKQKNGKIIITDKNGNIGYDWEYGDNPSIEKMRANGMSLWDIENVRKGISLGENNLKFTFKSVLFGFSDIEDGFGKNGRDLAEHFFSGQGKPFYFKTNSNPANEIKDSSEFKVFLNSLESELKARYFSEGAIKNGENGFNTSFPYYSPFRGAIDYRINEVATFVGGIQACEIFYELYEYSNNKIDLKIKKVIFYDTFGAGWEDGGAKGIKKQWIPGLVEMFILQHFMNVNNPTKHQPFTVIIEIEL